MSQQEIEALKARIKKLEAEHDSMLSSHRTLMAVYDQKKAPMYKQKASEALGEAGKRNRRIAELEAELAKLEKDSGNSN
ncbi:hypothetical protein BH10PSE11_BH10PSE11_36190 [soil metagenome]